MFLEERKTFVLVAPQRFFVLDEASLGEDYKAKL